MKSGQLDQLNLLEWRASASIHLFPLARRAALVRVVAGSLAENDDYSVWREAVEQLATELRALGSMSENEIQYRLLDFRDAVEAVLNSLGPDDGGTPQGVPTPRTAVIFKINRGHLVRNAKRNAQ